MKKLWLYLVLVLSLALTGQSCYQRLLDPFGRNSLAPKELLDMNLDAIPKEETRQMPESFSGEVLAGSRSPLLEFNLPDYQAALAGERLVILYYYANWCGTCKIEFPNMQKVFDAMQRDDVVGFRVNFNDSDTSEEEVELARKHGVAYQHTKVILKDGERVLKSPETWDEARYEQEISSRVNG